VNIRTNLILPETRVAAEDLCMVLGLPCEWGLDPNGVESRESRTPGTANPGNNTPHAVQQAGHVVHRVRVNRRVRDNRTRYGSDLTGSDFNEAYC